VTEPELRALVRDVIAQQLTGRAGPAPAEMSRGRADIDGRRHSSHATFVLPTGGDADGPCVIEPAVMCNHCGYCKSYGH